MSYIPSNPDQIRPTAKRSQYTHGRSIDLRCPLCDNVFDAYDGKYSREYGTRICIHCFKAAGQTPCVACHLIHGGECA